MKGNQVILIGYVGSDLEILQLDNGSKRVRIRLATHYQVKNTQGEKAWHTTWHNVVAWDTKAEYAERSFVKGSRIMVDGSIEYNTYPDKSGHTRYVTSIRVHSLMNLDR